MEKIFINLNFPDVDVVPVVNGKSWTTDTLCKQIISKFRAKRVFPQHIIVWLDKEANEDSSKKMSESFKKAFGAAGYPKGQVHCLIPDRMSENIILSHEPTIREVAKNDSYAYDCEGRNGKHQLKQIYRGVNVSYKETTHGPRLLKKIKLSQCHSSCVGVNIFLETFPLSCWWIK